MTHHETDQATSSVAPAPAITLTWRFDNRGQAHDAASALQEYIDPAPHALTLFEDGPGRWRIDSYYDTGIDTSAITEALKNALPFQLPACEQENVPDENWVAISQAALPPVRASRFTIFGSHDRARIAEGPNTILIDAGEAFGTAHHPTTFGCLEAIDRLTRRRHYPNCLDLGCGSGILAIALARVQRQTKILATDIDPQSINVAQANFALNRVSHSVSTVVASGLDNETLRQRAPYDLIIANILAGPLLSLANQIRAVSKPGTILVLSGILKEQAAAIIAAYGAQHFSLDRRRQIEEWVTLTFRRR